MTQDLQKAQDIMNEAVLEAMDKAAQEIFGGLKAGWQDGDLPKIFEVTEAHLNVLAARFQHPMLGGLDAWKI